MIEDDPEDDPEEIEVDFEDDLPSAPRPPLTPQQLVALRANADIARRMLDLLDGERSLHAYMKAIWTVIEPAQPFIDGWAIQAVCEHLEAVSAGQIRKLLITVPSGFSKSFLVNVFWPSWEWGPKRRPSERYICASYTQDLMVRDNVRCRDLIISDPYQAAWGDVFQLAEDQNTKILFKNDKTGWKKAAAACSVTGERGTRFVTDDPHSVQGAESEIKRPETIRWYSHTVPSRVSQPDINPFIVIMQRVHERDVAGFLLANDLGYDHLCIPMHYDANHPFKSHSSIGWRDPRGESGFRGVHHRGLVAEGYLAWPERFTERAVDDFEKQLSRVGGTYAVAGQGEQRPHPEGGGMFKRAWFRKWNLAIPPGQYVRAWDFASSENTDADWTVGLKMLRFDRGWIITNVVRRQWSPGKVRSLVVDTAQGDGRRCRIWIPKDPAQAGDWQAGDFALALGGYDVTAQRLSGTGDKAMRCRPVAGQAELGNVYIVEAEWNEVFLSEMESFPAGSHDDQADALSAAFGMLLDLPAQLPGAPPQPIVTQELDPVYEEY